MTNDVTLRSGSRFTGSNPTFTLEARTSGGPPTTSTWTRDGVEITSGISLEVDTDPQNSVTSDNRDAYLNARYISTLVVTGVSPGVYQYSASNRTMASPRTDSFTIEGIHCSHCRLYNDRHVCPKLNNKYAYQDYMCIPPWGGGGGGGGGGACYPVLFLSSRPQWSVCCMGWCCSSFSCLDYAMECGCDVLDKANGLEVSS